jgi:1-deoxy-D-xylulose-5-phosphate reductoisomerase
MRIPIQRALLWPACETGLCKGVNWANVSALQFELPDADRFPALAFAQFVMRTGGTSGAIVNAANEEAVAAFLQNRIPFGGIARVVQQVIEAVASTRATTLEHVLQAEQLAREAARAQLH